MFTLAVQYRVSETELTDFNELETELVQGIYHDDARFQRHWARWYSNAGSTILIRSRETLRAMVTVDPEKEVRSESL